MSDDKAVGLFLQESSKSLTAYAARSYNEQTFIKSAMLAIVEKPDLQACLKTTEGKASLFNALRFAASTGLSLNPQEGKAALIPYGGKVQYQVMKNGIIDLAMQSGKVEFVTCDVVKERDEFGIEKTSDGDNFKFRPALASRGKVIGFFAACKLKSGSTHVKWMTIEDVEQHRDKYSSLYNAKPDASPWKKSFEGMGLKTVIKALFRNLSISDELDNAFGAEDGSINEHEIINVTPKGTSSDDALTKLQAQDAPSAQVEAEKPQAQAAQGKQKGGDSLI